MKKTLLSVLGAFALMNAFSSAHAALITYTVTLPNHSIGSYGIPSGEAAFLLPKFDSSLGTLIQADFDVDGSYGGEFRLSVRQPAVSALPLLAPQPRLGQSVCHIHPSGGFRCSSRYSKA